MNQRNFYILLMGTEKYCNSVPIQLHYAYMILFEMFNNSVEKRWVVSIEEGIPWSFFFLFNRDMTRCTAGLVMLVLLRQQIKLFFRVTKITGY